MQVMNPTFFSDGGEDVEAITVTIHLKGIAVNVTSAYGPLDNALSEKKHAFWSYLTEQSRKAKATGKGVIMQGDFNSWLGPQYLPGDLRPQNTNGKLFQMFLKGNILVCVNTLPLTKGLITWRRRYLNEIQESTIDFYVVCESVIPFVKHMEILNHTDHNITRYSTNEKAVSSDHAPLLMEVTLESVPTKKIKTVIPNFNDKESQMKFRQATSHTTAFTDCFQGDKNVLTQCETWLSKVKAHIKISFKKIRIRPLKIRSSAADGLIKQRNKFLKQGEIDKSHHIDAKIISEEGRIKASMFRKFCNPNKSNVLSEMWQLKKKLFPKKPSTLPSSK